MSEWKIEIIEDWESIYSFANQERWLRIMNQSPNSHVFFHPALVRAWSDTYIPLRKLFPLFVYGKKAEIEVIFPLVLWKRNWKGAFQKLIVPIGYSDFDYHDPVFSVETSNEDIQDFYRQLLALLNNWRYDNIVLDGLHKRNLPAIFDETHQEPCPYIDLSSFNNSDDYLDSLSKNVRKTYKRRKSNMESEYEVAYSVYEDWKTWNRAGSSFESMMSFHSERWPKAFKAPNFHANLIKHGMGDGLVSIYVVRIGQEDMIWQLAFKYRSTLYLYMPSFNPQISEYSPGRMSLMFCVKDAYLRGIVKIDQLRGEESYKNDWTLLSDTIYTMEYNRKTILSKLIKRVLQIKRKLGR